MRNLTKRIDAFIASEVNFSPAQRRILMASDPIVLTRACPGAGKTRVFAARFAKEAAIWQGNRGGIAALSFTNVAQREIQRRVVELGVPSGYPHFIGTIDAFLLRFVVKVFAKDIVNLARFIRPYEDGEYGIQMETFQASDDPQHVCRLSQFVIRPGDPGRAKLFVESREGIWREVPAGRAAPVLVAKKLAWKKDGELTYADVCAVAWKLLEDDQVRDVVCSRFPVILVDEFQDTTGLRAPCLQRLFEGQGCRLGFVVGDPDQSIMTFAGAHPHLFEVFEALPGAQSYVLSESYRAHDGITSVATFLRRTPGAIESAVARPEGARVLLVGHDHSSRAKAITDVPTAFEEFVRTTATAPTQAVILTWADSDVRRLDGRRRTGCPFTAESVNAIVDGIIALRRGHIQDAVTKVEGVVGRAVFGRREPQRDQLALHGMNPRDWRSILLSLLGSLQPGTDETKGQWFDRIKCAIEDAAGAVTGEKVKLGHQLHARLPKKANREAILGSDAGAMFPEVGSAGGAGVRVLRVHQVKGEEYEAVCVFVPKPEKDDPSATGVLLEASGEGADEARRVTFVAMTRAKRHLIIVLPRDWLAELDGTARGQLFVQSFDNKLPLAVSDIAMAGVD